MIELFGGFLLTIISLLIGFQLGKYQRLIPEQTQKKINQIFKRVVPNSEVGAVAPLTQRELYLTRNPKLKEEQEVLEKELNILNQ